VRFRSGDEVVLEGKESAGIVVASTDFADAG
jgi:hypothetical protein